MENKKLSFREHLSELKKRLIYILVFFLGAAGLAYFYANDLYHMLLLPLNKVLYDYGKDLTLIYTDITEAFFTYVKLSLWTAVIISLPFAFWQIYLFIAPALTAKQKKLVFLYMYMAVILFILGSLIAYYFVFPNAWHFFLSFGNNLQNSADIKLTAKISEYLSLSMYFIMIFGFTCQFPIILMMLEKMQVVSIKTLRKKRRFAIVLIFIIAAIITPPDALSQIILAVIMIILYELTIIGCNFQKRKI